MRFVNVISLGHLCIVYFPHFMLDFFTPMLLRACGIHLNPVLAAVGCWNGKRKAKENVYSSFCGPPTSSDDQVYDRNGRSDEFIFVPGPFKICKFMVFTILSAHRQQTMALGLMLCSTRVLERAKQCRRWVGALSVIESRYGSKFHSKLDASRAEYRFGQSFSPECGTCIAWSGVCGGVGECIWSSFDESA